MYVFETWIQPRKYKRLTSWLPESCGILHRSRDVMNLRRYWSTLDKIPEKFPDWKAYREDIKNAEEQRPSRGSAAKLGCFSVARDQQWAAKKEHLQQFPASARSKSAAGMAEVESNEELENEDIVDEGSGARLTPAVTHGSDISVANAYMYPPSLGEEVANVAAVTFLRILTMRCFKVELKWEVRRKGFEAKLGEASIRAHTDGCLSSEDDAKNIHGIVEVKPFPIAKNSEKAFMQMRLEMIAFILYCELNGMSKER